MTIIEQLEEKKKQLQNLEKERMRVEGKQSQLMEQLKAEGCNSYEEGIAERDRLLEEERAATEEATRLLAELNEKYAAFL